MADNYEVITQDAYCFHGCLPEGYGAESNGDTFPTHKEALEDASSALRATLEDAGWSAKAIRAADAELRANGEWAADLDYIIDDGSENDGTVDPNGTRFVSFAVVLVDCSE